MLAHRRAAPAAPGGTRRCGGGAAAAAPPRRRPPPPRAAAAPGGGQEQTFADVMASVLAALQQQAAAPAAERAGAHLRTVGVGFHPPGAPAPLLAGASLELRPGQLGVVFGPSGGGKSTLLQLVAGLAEPTAGHVSLTADGAPAGAAARRAAAGLVFQFPERHFLGGTLGEEMAAGWPPGAAERAARSAAAWDALRATGLDGLPLDAPLGSLSGGTARRAALAAQLARAPPLLLLDEPLAGLDWRARRGLVALLGRLRARGGTTLAASHDLRELAPLADAAWRCEPAPGGAALRRVPLEELRRAAAAAGGLGLGGGGGVG